MPRIDRVVGVGIDYGTSNASAALMVGLTRPEQGKKRRLILMDEWRYDPRNHHGATLAPSDQAKRYVEWLGLKHTPTDAMIDPEYHVVDPAASHFSAELRKYPDLQLAGATNAVLPGIATVAGLLSNDQLLVTDRCSGFTSEVTEYRWDEKATNEGRDEVVKEDDHSLDAGRYGVHTTRSSWRYELDAA
jgi:hypothetical protein